MKHSMFLGCIDQGDTFQGRLSACINKGLFHFSSELKCSMNFGVFVPGQAKEDVKFPVIYWLSGLTCTEQNFVTKAGAQRYAAEHEVIIVAPDTSPRKEITRE